MLLRLLERMLLRSNDPARLDSIGQWLSRLTIRVNDKIRRLKARQASIPERLSDDGRSRLEISVKEPRAPWSDIELPACSIPGMISHEDRQYYCHIGRFYTGRGALVELGPWLGCSTFFILEGLKGNPNFNGHKLHVYDDFVWRSAWMNCRVDESEQHENHQDFQPLFEKYAAPFRHRLAVEKRMIAPYDGDENLLQLVWSGRPIEMIYVDCGRTQEVNETWYSLLSGSFIPNHTLIIMQDWGTHRAVPVAWFNQMKQFVDSKGSALKLIHELKHGDVAAFLYCR